MRLSCEMLEHRHLLAVIEFDPAEVLSAQFEAPSSVQLADLDSDGDTDLLFAEQSLEAITWYENVDVDGRGTFSEQIPTLIHENLLITCRIAVGDLDNDLDLDVVAYGCDNEEMYWFVAGEQGDRPGTPVSHRILKSNVNLTRTLDLADFDNDGDVDIVVGDGSYIERGPGKLYWFENVDRNGTFEQHEIDSAPGSLGVIQVADVDGDGFQDLLVRENYVYKLIHTWYLNSGRPEEFHSAGDANRDLRFDQHDIVQVLQAAKYQSGEPATWEQGDWNGDGRFDQLDVVLAQQTGEYLNEEGVILDRG